MTGDEFLQAIENVSEVRRLTIRPGDTVVLLLAEHISQRRYDAFCEFAKASFPDNRVVVLDAGIDIAVASVETEATLLNLLGENQ